MVPQNVLLPDRISGIYYTSGFSPRPVGQHLKLTTITNGFIFLEVTAPAAVHMCALFENRDPILGAVDGSCTFMLTE